MGDTHGNDDGVAERRAFVRRLRADEDVRSVDFSRDGFRPVVVYPEPGVGFRRRWRRTATRLGYTVRRGGTDGSTDRPEGRRRLRHAVRRGRAFLDRLVGRSNR